MNVYKNMSKNFWSKLNKPIYALAPMAGVTDSAFRQICKKFGADVLYSEMASATALAYNPEKTLEMLEFLKIESPYVVQLFGNDPKYFAKATNILNNYNFSKNKNNKICFTQSGIDINFGCPVKKIIKQGAGSMLMQNLKLSREVIKNVINNTSLPVSIKLRSKSGDIDCLRFLDYMKDLDIKAAMIHGRTFKQGFIGKIDTEIIKKSRNYFNGIILANGGVMNAQSAKDLLSDTKADGIGIARGAMGKPWIFSELKFNSRVEFYSILQIFKIIIKHAKLVEKLKGKSGIIKMRKHLSWYVQGLPNARKMREKLVKVEDVNDIKKILKNL